MGVGKAYLFFLEEDFDSLERSEGLKPDSTEVKKILMERAGHGEAYAVGRDNGISLDMIFLPRGFFLIDGNSNKDLSGKVYRMEPYRRIEFFPEYNYWGSGTKKALDRITRNIGEDVVALGEMGGERGLYTEFIRIEPYSIPFVYRRKGDKTWIKKLDNFVTAIRSDLTARV